MISGVVLHRRSPGGAKTGGDGGSLGGLREVEGGVVLVD